jgi:hypothetical protein
MWLGHDSMDVTQMYLHADIELKGKALAKTEPFQGRPGPIIHLTSFWLFYKPLIMRRVEK